MDYGQSEAIRGGAKGGMSETQRLTEKIQNIVKEKNLLSHDLENVLAENALLRQMSKVPDNFGETIEAYKLDQKENAVYYKRKNEYLEKEIKELSEELTRKKTELRRFAGFFARTDRDKLSLNDEQQRFLDDVTINLIQGKMEIPLTDNSKELQKQVEKLQTILNTYDNIMQTQKLKDSGSPTAGLNEHQMTTLLEAIKEGKQEQEKLSMKHAMTKSRNLDASIREERLDGSLREDRSHREVRDSINNTNRPPRPLAGVFGDWTEVNEGVSYKFGSKLNLKTYDEELAGMDMDKAKYYIAVLQLHNMESMEVIYQREMEFRQMTQEIEELRGDLRKSLLVQDELFVRHHQELSKVDARNSETVKENRNLKTLNLEYAHKLEVFEKTISAVQSKSPASVEGRLAEMTKNCALAETTIIKLSRKYDCLEAEHGDLSRCWKIMEADHAERESVLVEKLNKLLEWKGDAGEKLKILLARVQNSVPAEEHEAIKSRLEIMTLKYTSAKNGETAASQSLAEAKGVEREALEKEDQRRKMVVEVEALEAEYAVLHLRLCALDPVYNRFTNVFKKIAGVLKAHNLSPLAYFQSVDTNKDGTLGAGEFSRAMESMGVVMNPEEADSFFKFLDVDSSGRVDYVEFSRKLRRFGVALRTREEDVVSKMWAGIVKARLTLEEAYKAIDRKGEKAVTFNDMVQAFRELEVEVDAKTASEFFRVVDVSGNGSISPAEFYHVFKKYNKQGEAVLGPDSTLDWKLELMVRLDRLSREKDKPLEEVFKEIDTDGRGRIEIEEFRRMFLKMGVPIQKAEFLNLFNAIDRNRSGGITFAELLEFMNVEFCDRRRPAGRAKN